MKMGYVGVLNTDIVNHCYCVPSPPGGVLSKCLCTVLRLVGGDDATSGRVEFLFRSRWGSVCDDDFDDADARVICRQLGLEGGEARTGAYFGRGEGDIWLSRLDCLGNETDVMTCERDDAAAASCVHEEDAGVICSACQSHNSHICLLNNRVVIAEKHNNNKCGTDF